MSYNKAAIHEAYLDMRKELGVPVKAEDKEGEVKVTKKKVATHDDNNLSQKKSEKKEKEESASESESESQSESEDDGSPKRKEKKKRSGSKKKSKKNKKKKSKKSKKNPANAQVNETAASNATQPAASLV